MGHKPDQRARKKRRVREAKAAVTRGAKKKWPSFADNLRENSKKAPDALRAQANKQASEFVEETYQACRARARDESLTGSRSATIAIGPPTFLNRQTEENAVLNRIAKRLRRTDALAVTRREIGAGTHRKVIFEMKW